MINPTHLSFSTHAQKNPASIDNFFCAARVYAIPVRDAINGMSRGPINFDLAEGLVHMVALSDVTQIPTS